MSYRRLILSVFTLIVGLAASTVAMANPTCTCDEICTRVENRCLNQGGSVSQCAQAYDNCFISCGDTWPCPSTCETPFCPPEAVSETGKGDFLGLKIPFWMASESGLAAQIEASEEAPRAPETSGTSTLDD